MENIYWIKANNTYGRWHWGEESSALVGGRSNLISYVALWTISVQKGAISIYTVYDFHNSTDTLKFWTEKRAINKTFLYFIWFWWNCSTHWVLQLHQVSSKSDEKQNFSLIARFSVQNFKVSVESWKSYIV